MQLHRRRARRRKPFARRIRSDARFGAIVLAAKGACKVMNWLI
jgi:hypothetical protein